jgi:hypothetical protein
MEVLYHISGHILWGCSLRPYIFRPKKNGIGTSNFFPMDPMDPMDPSPWSLGIGRAQCGLAASKRTDVDTGDHRVDLDACAGSALEIWRTGG